MTNRVINDFIEKIAQLQADNNQLKIENAELNTDKEELKIMFNVGMKNAKIVMDRCTKLTYENAKLVAALARLEETAISGSSTALHPTSTRKKK